MAATKRQFNWTAVGFTPSGGSLSTATGVTNVSISRNGTLDAFSGDNDRYNTTVINGFNDPTITITTADVAWVNAIAAGTRGSLTATHKDAKGGSGGDAVYVLANAVSQGGDTGGAHRAFGSSTLTFKAESSDGQTNPLTFSYT